MHHNVCGGMYRLIKSHPGFFFFFIHWPLFFFIIFYLVPNTYRFFANLKKYKQDGEYVTYVYVVQDQKNSKKKKTCFGQGVGSQPI